MNLFPQRLCSLTALLCLWVLTLSPASGSLKQQTCTSDHTATIQPQAAAWLGGIISLSGSGTGGYGCGKPSGSMQAYEAIRWVLDLLNKKEENLQGQYLEDYYVPGIPIGLKMHDYCSNVASALSATVDIFPEIGGDSDTCTVEVNNMTLGIIGASTSSTTMHVSDSISSYDIPIISYEATTSKLTEPGMYTNFMRTISPDSPLMDVIVQVLRKFQWHKLVIVYESGVYGTTAYNELHAKLVAAGICLTAGVVVEDERDLASAESVMERVMNHRQDSGVTAVVFFGAPQYAEALIKAGNTKMNGQPDVGQLQWLFVEFPVDIEFESTSVYQRGIISVSAASRFIVEFEDHWIRLDEANPSPENPWFKEWFEERHSCKFGASLREKECTTVYPDEMAKRQRYQQDQYVEAAVMSVFAYARALRTAQISKCGTLSPGMCPQLQQMTRVEFFRDFLKKVDFTFSATERVPSLASKNVLPYNAPKHLKFTDDGDIDDPSYFVYNYNNIGSTSFSFKRVGSYISNRLDLNLDNVAIYDTNRHNRVDPVPSSKCPLHGCSPCIGLPADVKYYYEPGDLIVNGIFSLHQQGSSPLACGAPLSHNKYQYLEAMIYAVQRINTAANILPNIKLGGVGLDDCSSPVLGQGYLAQVQRGNLVIHDASGTSLDPLTIEAYTAAYNSPLTLPIAEAMNILRRPLVGYRAASSQLDDSSRFPYFVRSVPGITNEIKAIIMMLKKLNWMHVQVIISSEYYSMDAEKTFRELGAQAGICIVARHDIGKTDDQVDIALTGVGRNPAVHPVVVLLDTHDYPRLLEGLTRNRGIEIGNSFSFIATSRIHAPNKNVIKGFEAVTNKLIALSYRQSTLNNFKDYLRALKPDTHSTTNPWFLEWYQGVHNCSIDASAGGSVQACDLTESIVDGENFQLLSEVDSVIHAVEAIARGLDTTLTDYCGAGYTSICLAFTTAVDKGQRFLNNIKNLQFISSEYAQTIKFVGSSAALPFEIYLYEKDRNIFDSIGKVNPWDETLTLDETDVPLWNTAPRCLKPCLECLYTFNHLNYWYTPGDLVIASIFDVHYKGTGPYDCGTLRHKNGALYTEVFNFALQRINHGKANVRLNGVTLGGLAFDGCSNPTRASAIINRVHTGMEIKSNTDKFDVHDLVSWISYDSETTVEAATLLRSLGTPIVSPGATTRELDDKTKYSTFFRTIPSDSVVVRGMAEFVRSMGWRYVVSLNAPELASRESRDYFRELLAGFGICVVASYEFDTDGSPEVIYNSIKGGNTQVVAVFADPDRYVEDFLKELPQGFRDLLFVANRPWDEFAKSNNYKAATKGSVTFSLETPSVSEFITYLDAQSVKSSDNPWLKSTYEAIYGCNFPGTYKYNIQCGTSPITDMLKQDMWTLSTIHAVYAIADAINASLTSQCGSNYNGMCSSFRFASNRQGLVIDAMDDVNFMDIEQELFKFVEREADRRFKVHTYSNSGSPINEGSLDRDGSLTLSDANRLKRDYIAIQSNCVGKCLQCTGDDNDLQDFTMISGDVYLIGLFDVHKSGDTPFTCGNINDKHGLPLLEAFNYAIEYVNGKKGIFSDKLLDIRLGGIGLDTCQSASRAANMVANIHSGHVKLVKNGITVPTRRIEGYIGPMDTESTLRVADILTQLAIPQISYGATGVELLDVDRYDYFLRSVPADDKQARAVISFLKKFEYNNIQLVSSFDEIGEPGRAEFLKLALVNKICVKTEHTDGDSSAVGSNPASIIDKISQDSEARVVILWMKNPIPILEAASAKTAIVDNFMFIVTDKWGADPDVLLNPKLKQLLDERKLIVLDVETADIPLYDEYLEMKTPDNYPRNPWFKEYFEDFQNCYWNVPNNLQQCDKSSTIPRADKYIQDPYVLYVVNAVFSAALSIDKAVKKLCSVYQGNFQSRGMCDYYLTNGERRQEVMEALKTVNFVDDTHQPYFYTEDGQSDRGFHIYNVTNVDGPNTPFRYENVGSYNDSHFLKLDITYAPQVEAKCDADRSDPNLKDCVCEFPADQPSRYMLTKDGGRGLTLVYVGDIHQPSTVNPLQCGPINTGPDLLKLLAFFYAIVRVNSNADRRLTDSIKLDGLALDSCTNGLRLGQDIYNVLSGNQLCDSDSSGLLVSPASIVAFVVDKDHNALPVSSMLTPEKILTISPTAGLTQLQNDLSYPYFLSTRGPYSEVAAAILETAHEIGWDYLSVIYTDSISYRSSKDAVLSSSRSSGVCVGESISLAHDASLSNAKSTLERISSKVGASAIVLFVTPSHLNLLLRASKSLGLAGRFVWLIHSDWAHAEEIIQGLEAEIAGSVMFESKTTILEDFNNYVQKLTFNNRHNIPDDWFLDIYQTVHQCNILNQLQVEQGRRYPKVCTGDERIGTDSQLYSQDPAVLHVILSVYAAAEGLNDIKKCESFDVELAACLQLLGDDRTTELRDAVAGVEFDVLPDLLDDKTFEFSFDRDGNGRLGVVISNFQASSGESSYTLKNIGSYIDNTLSLDKSKYAARNLYTQGSWPTSSCQVGTRCTCQLTGGRNWMYAPTNVLDSSNIEVGGRYTDPDNGAIVQVEEIPDAADRFDDTWAIILLVFIIIGIVVSLGVFLYLLVMYPVRGGTSILGFMLSFGIILMYLLAIAFIAHATKEICGLRRFALGVIYAFVYASLLVKLVDCWRVRGKDDSYAAKYSKLGRPFGLFLVTIFIVLVQVMISTEWLILREPDMERIFYDDKYWPRCTPDNFYDEGLVLSLCYVMFIIVVSIFVALLSFTTTKNHRESRWILGILILAVPCWVIWCTVSILGSVRIRDAAVAIGLVVNATIMLLLVPVRKLYLLHKYNVLLDEEEEEQEAKRREEATSQRDDYGPYDSVYGQQYDNKAHLHDSGSIHSSVRGDYSNPNGNPY